VPLWAWIALGLAAWFALAVAVAALWHIARTRGWGGPSPR